MNYTKGAELIWVALWQFKDEPEDHNHPLMKLVEETGEYVGACIDARVKPGKENPALKWLELCDITFYHRILYKQAKLVGKPFESPVFLKDAYPDKWPEYRYALTLAHTATSLAEFYEDTEDLSRKEIKNYLDKIYTLCIKSARYHYGKGWSDMVTSNYNRLVANGVNGWINEQ